MKNKGTYIYELFRLKCAPDLLALGLYPNHKEWCESIGAYNAVVEHTDFDLKDKSVTVVVVGDGVTPRTGAMFAFRSKWNVISVDPLMKCKKKFKSIDRLTMFKGRIEELDQIDSDKLIIVGVHSHASAQVSWNVGKDAKESAFINIPCCKSSDMVFKATKTYNDPLIPTQKNSIEVYLGGSNG